MFQFLEPKGATIEKAPTLRTEVHGKDHVPSMSFRLKFRGPNSLIDLLRADLLPKVYEADDDQDNLPGVEKVRQKLISPDIRHFSFEDISYAGWTVVVEHGIDNTSRIEFGKASIDDFHLECFQGGTVEIECRVGVSGYPEGSAEIMHGKQAARVEFPVSLIAPKALETNPGAIDGTQAAFERDHPQTEDERQATLLDAMKAGGPDDADSPDDQADGEGSDPDATSEPQRGPVWPFPEEKQRQMRAAEVAAKGDYDVALEKPKRKGRGARAAA